MTTETQQEGGASPPTVDEQVRQLAELSERKDVQVLDIEAVQGVVDNALLTMSDKNPNKLLMQNLMSGLRQLGAKVYLLEEANSTIRKQHDALVARLGKYENVSGVIITAR